jgi:hypothetical protein
MKRGRYAMRPAIIMPAAAKESSTVDWIYRCQRFPQVHQVYGVYDEVYKKLHHLKVGSAFDWAANTDAVSKLSHRTMR